MPASLGPTSAQVCEPRTSAQLCISEVRAENEQQAAHTPDDLEHCTMRFGGTTKVPERMLKYYLSAEATA